MRFKGIIVRFRLTILYCRPYLLFCWVVLISAPPPYAAQLFKERDYAAMDGTTLDLMCKRMDTRARVVWETVDIGGHQVDLIFDSDNDTEASGDNYELIELGDDIDDFTLRITVTEDTALFTRCAVTYNTLTDVSATAMVFKLGEHDVCLVAYTGCRVIL